MWCAPGVASLALLAPGAAAADRGVAIDAGRIAIDQPLQRGGGYTLPTIGVRNPGTERTSYRVAVSYLNEQKERRPPASWFRFTPRQLTLAAGKSRPVQVRLIVPTNAEPGKYSGLLEVRIVSTGTGAQVGAGAGARLSFRIEPSSTLEAWWIAFKRLMSEHAPWTYLIPALAAALTVVRQLAKRLRINVTVRT
jgi:hypothetical protein